MGHVETVFILVGHVETVFQLAPSRSFEVNITHKFVSLEPWLEIIRGRQVEDKMGLCQMP